MTGEYFESLGIRPALGRLLTPEDDRVGGGHGIVLSYRFWREFCGADENVVGKSVKLLDLSFEVVGIAPENFLGLEPGFPPDAYIPHRAQWRFNPNFKPGEGAMGFFTMARLKPEVPLQAAKDTLRERWPTLEPRRNNPPANRNRDPEYVTFRDGSRGYSPLRLEFSQAIYTLLGLAVAVFLIACANLASLLVVRGIERNGETSMRLAL